MEATLKNFEREILNSRVLSADDAYEAYITDDGIYTIRVYLRSKKDFVWARGETGREAIDKLQIEIDEY